MVFRDEPIEVGYVEKSPPRCIWYGIACNEKKCDGNRNVNCRIKQKRTLYSRMEGEYTRITLRNPRVLRTHCISFLEEGVYQARVNVSA